MGGTSHPLGGTKTGRLLGVSLPALVPNCLR
jgi:hypothetical protein